DILVSGARVIVGSSHGLVLLPPAQEKPRRMLEQSHINALSPGPTEHQIWVGTMNNLYLADLVDGHVEHVPFFSSRTVRAVWRSSSAPRRVYVGCDRGLFFYSTEFSQWLRAELGISPVTCCHITGDARGEHLFLATDHGVFMSQDSGLTFNRQTSGLPDLPCTSITIAGSRIVALFSNNTLYHKDVNEFQWHRLAGFEIPVWDVWCEEGRDEILVGTRGFGVIALDSSCCLVPVTAGM
ncbi:hypothetical protein JW905_00755, partial [bacterium]|nr:hypothetical protein [candidate division CSSED10-310 bacterium]